MPAPPRPDESKQHFLRRAIRYLIREGRSRRQAAAIANQMWRDRGKK